MLKFRAHFAFTRRLVRHKQPLLLIGSNACKRVLPIPLLFSRHCAYLHFLLSSDNTASINHIYCGSSSTESNANANASTSKAGGFRVPTAPAPPLNGVKRGPVTAPFGKPGSQQPSDSTTSTDISMVPHQQLVPTVRPSEVAPEQQHAYVPIPANDLDGEDSGDDDFHDAQEDLNHDLFHGVGANSDRNAPLPQQQGHQANVLPQSHVFNACASQYAAPQQQSHQISGLRDMMDLTGDDADEQTKIDHGQSHNEWDEWATTEEDFRDNGVYLDQYLEQGQQQAAPAQNQHVNGGFSFDQQPQQYRTDRFHGGYVAEEQPQHDQHDQEGHLDGNNASMNQFRDVGIPESNEEEQANAASPMPDEEEGDLFSSTFGPNVKDEDNDDDSDLEILDAPDFDAALKAKGLSFDPTSHPTNSIQHRILTPPLPGTSSHSATSINGPSTKRKRERPAKNIYGNPFDGRIKAGPCLDRDTSPNLRAHFRWHSKVFDLVPRLPNWEDLDWKRRYWIAVLLEGKKPKSANSEKDFVWMKGNRFSTVRTVMEKYAQTTLGDKSSRLMMGYEIVEPEDQMQELDYFADRLCVFRVLPQDHPDLERGQSFVEGIIPPIPEVIELDDD